MSRKFVYFDFNGYGEGIRYLLHYGELKFEDIRYKREDWPIESVKESLPYGQMPLYEDNGQSINQSFAIARYVASLIPGLLPLDPWEQAKLDAAVLNLYDMLKKIVPLLKSDADKKEQSMKEVIETIDYYFTRVEIQLKQGNGHFSGKLSWADFMLVSIVEALNLYIPNKVQEKYNAIVELMEKVTTLPGVKEYVASRTPYTPLF